MTRAERPRSASAPTGSSTSPSSRRTSTRSRVGKVPGEPYKFNARGAEALDLALSDGTIVATEDGGKTWKTAFQP